MILLCGCFVLIHWPPHAGAGTLSRNTPTSRSAQLQAELVALAVLTGVVALGYAGASSPGTDHLRAADTNGPGPGYVRDGPGQQRGHLLLAGGVADVLVDPRCSSTGHRRCRHPRGRSPRGLGTMGQSPAWQGRTRRAVSQKRRRVVQRLLSGTDAPAAAVAEDGPRHRHGRVRSSRSDKEVCRLLAKVHG